MANEVPGTSSQKYMNNLAAAAQNVAQVEDFFSDKGVHNISLQTGEEFSTEFLRDRVLPRRAPVMANPNELNHHQQHMRAGGFNQALSYEDLTVIQGIRRRDSENSSSNRNGLGVELEPGSSAHSEITNRYYRDYGRTEQTTPATQSGSPRDHDHGSLTSDVSSFSGKVKLLCSFGGRILARPGDGKLKYVGGETKIISIRENSSFNDLVKKTSAICNQMHMIKYELPGEDLDALISVSSNEDLHHMMEECHDLARASQRLRIFLITPGECESPDSIDGRTSSQQNNDSDCQYVYAVNSIETAPQRTLSGQSSLQRENPSMLYPSEIREGSNSPRLNFKRSNQAASQLMSALQIPSKGYNQSPPLSPATHRNNREAKPSNLVFDDRGRKPNYYIDQTMYGESNPTSHLFHKQLDSEPRFHNHNHNPSQDFLSSGLYSQSDIDLSRHILNETQLPSDDSMGQFHRFGIQVGLSGNKLPHAISDPQLQHDERAGPQLGDAKIPRHLSNFEAEASVPYISNMSRPSGHNKEHIDWSQGMSNWTDNPHLHQDWKQQQYDADESAIQNAHQNKYFYQLETSNLLGDGQRVTKEDTDGINKGVVKGQKVSSGSPREHTEEANRTNLTGFVHNEPEFLSLNSHLKNPFTDDRSSGFHQESVTLSNKNAYLHEGNPFQSPTNLDGGKLEYRGDYLDVPKSIGENNPPKLIVEDVTSQLPTGIPSSSTVVPIVQEQSVDEDKFARRTNAESFLGSDPQFVKGGNGEQDESISDAALAEREAGAYGLQIIKYADIEELQELGSGTFGTVYHGKWRGTDVAIKRIKKSCFAGSSTEQERLAKDFWREAHILSKLHHPNVVAFYGVVPDGPGGTLATVTEYMSNGSLRNVLIRKHKVLDKRKKLLIAMDAAFGMEYLHMKNIIHFDLKCENLLVNMGDHQRPICKVGDFGLSRIKRNTLVSGGVRGTLPWMAPELLDGNINRVSEKVDVYSFAITMWEIMTGEEPYANMHFGAIIGGIVSNSLRPPMTEECDREWKELIETCWSPNPAARPSFTEVANKLRLMSMALHPKKGKT
ncbi:uncharacterized protein LOC124912669 [Impatiens glandulifera]|uniref:uncharacterized protein LOC124912669 n=1 Tax=Impatiens glandulifera TaxID=253017 RepID=UPI001FB0CE73|nr:uncharacterized protein LOC124912669 [Impatiens glandulifera]